MTEDAIRISVGTEHIDDIIADFEQSFATSSAVGKTKEALIDPVTDKGQQANGALSGEH